MRDGDLRDDVDPGLIAELVYSAVYVRLLFGYGSLDRAFAESIVALALGGAAVGAPAVI